MITGRQQVTSCRGWYQPGREAQTWAQQQLGKWVDVRLVGRAKPAQPDSGASPQKHDYEAAKMVSRLAVQS